MHIKPITSVFTLRVTSDKGTTSQQQHQSFSIMSYGPGTETIRFRRPTAGPNAVAEKQKKVQEDDIRDVDRFGGKHAPLPAWKKRHRGLLQDQVGR